MYQLIFSNQTNLLQVKPNQERVEGIYPIRFSTGADITLCIRQGRALLGYKYEEATETWLQDWHETIFNVQNNYPLERYPWLVAHKLLRDREVIILRHPEGIRFYQVDMAKPGLELLKADGHFHDVYGYTLLLGSIYPNTDWIGVMTRNIRGDIKFYGATQDSFLPNEPYPLFPLNMDLSLTSAWHSDDTNFFLTKLCHNGPAAIGLRTNTGLEFYKFNADYLLAKITNTSRIIKPDQNNGLQDRLYFANLTNQVYQDILQLNDSGLFVYQYNNNQEDYIPLHHHPEFMQTNGWLSRYSDSIQLFDLNSDGHEDLLFTGPHGLTALTFDPTAIIWKTLLNPEQLNGSQRYATCVGTLPAMPPGILEPSIFIQDTQGQLQWARIIESINSQSISDLQTTYITTVGPVEPTTRETPSNNNVVIPKQIAYTALTDKPILRWAEQWEDNFLNEAVDMTSGQVKFTVPLVDTSTETGLGVQLALFYHSEAKSTELLGIGWSIPLAQDYIFVDYKGSIYPEDADYYLMLQGRPQLLQLIATEERIRRFELAEQSIKDSQVTIEYYPSEQYWIIEHATEQVIYGKATKTTAAAANALQWSLEWPNWRGPGRDTKQLLQPVIMAWYLNVRLAKHHQQKLYYHYETDIDSIGSGKTYTTAFRLKTISDGQQMRLVFDYAAKTKTEYTVHNPEDDQGNIVFPVPLTQKHYLKGYSITTATYHQILQFVYEMNNGQRLLTAFQQQLLLAHHESVLQFSYQRVLEKQVLTSCILPCGSTVNFSYEPINSLTATFASNNVLSYPVRERPKIAYGPDYAIMAYRDLYPVNGKIILRIMNREMTRTIIDCSVDASLSCPSAQSEIKDYTLQAYHNFFMVLVESDKNQSLHLFDHYSQTWMAYPNVLSFSKGALIRLSEILIAVAEPNPNSITLFKRLNNQATWNKTKLSVLKVITRLTLHQQLVIGYDDDTLWRFYLDPQHRLKRSALAHNLGHANQALARFNLGNETQQQLLTELNQNGLQIFNNFILLSSIQENSGQLFSNVSLFLLGAQYDVVKNQKFKIQREHILSLTYDLKQENSTYQLGYVQEGGYFKIKVKSISGDIIKDIEPIRNENKKQDAMEDRIKTLNQQEGFQELSKTTVLIDWKLYSTKITQQGVYCGTDTLLRITGNGWQNESVAITQSIDLGKHFLLELSGDNRELVKLYALKQQNKQEPPLKQLTIQPGSLINGYPVYLAYQPTTNSVQVITFKDEQTLGQIHTFQNEQLLLESDWQNLFTVANASTGTIVHAESQECLVRPLSTLTSSKLKLFVNQSKLTNGDIQRLTGYKHSFSNDQQQLTYSETVALIPGANKNLSGWYEETRSYHFNSDNVTTTKNWFDANNQSVLGPPEQHQAEQVANTNNTPNTTTSLLLDLSNQLLISDFSPYDLADEMNAYYGFESYENNQIGTPIINSDVATKNWRFDQAQIVKDRFAFTGKNYLQLKSTLAANASFLEGVFQPRDQEDTYLATCWLRCNIPLTINTPVSYLKAIISTTSGQEIIGLLALVKHQVGDWSYLELPIDFQLIKQIYQNYVTYLTADADNNTISKHLSPENAKFQITLRVEADQEETVDLDHIRFSPFNYDFQATIYQTLTGKPSAVIQTNGLVARTLYNRLHQEIASLQEDGQLQYLTSGSRTGRLDPAPQGALAGHKANHLNFQSESGFYETFDAYALRTRWKLEDPIAWRIAPGQLWHEKSERHRIEAKAHVFDETSAAVRFYFALQSSQACLSLNWQGISNFQFTRQSNNFTILNLPNNHSITPLPLAGELIVMLEQNYAWLWLDGVLLLDQALPISGTNANLLTPWSDFAIEAQGQVLIEDCLIINRPEVQIDYYNAFGEKTQVIKLEDALTAQVTETLYDELGRGAITTKTTRIHRNAGQPLLAYRPDFVININPADRQSVWHTGQLQGEVDQLNPNEQGVAYARIKYAPNPLNEESVFGLPGPDFSVTGRYATKISRHADISFLSILFPANQGYRQKVEHLPNDSKNINIFDKYNNQVARYTRVPSFNHLLSIYEYNQENRLVKILPPLYHEKVNTSSKLTYWQTGEQHLSTQEKQWQQALGSHFSYDENGNLIRKITPDSGTEEYLYNSASQMRFMASLGPTNQTEQIVYFEYDMHGQLSRTGHLNQLLSITALQQYLESQFLPNAQDYQLFDYADSHLEPLLRGRIKYCITYNQDQPVAEEIHFNSQQHIIAKNTLTMSGQNETEHLTNLTKQYMGGKVHTIEYPIIVNGQLLRLVHHYNKLGQLVKLGIPDNQALVKFTYHASGQLASEHYQPNTSTNFTRSYRYNPPGFLEQLSDPFLTEDITYTEKGYGQPGYGDGMIMQTLFNASWPANADSRWFQIQDDALASNYSVACISALKRTGYLTNNGQPVKLYVRETETALPLVCGGKTGQKLTKLVAERQMPRYYGHRYAYGNHQELVKAKYFTDDTKDLIEPLQPDSFTKEISSLNPQESQDIWQLLTNAGYIIVDQRRSNLATSIGKRGKSFFRDTEMQTALAELNGYYTLYVEPIKRLIIAAISQQRPLSLEDFKATFLHWQDIDHTTSKLLYNWYDEIAEQIGQMLLAKGYLSTPAINTRLVLDTNFTTILSCYSHFIPEIVKVLSQHFAHALGETAFDVESYEIDANGNHHHFYTGFNRYKLIYRNNTNQIQNIELDWPTAFEPQQVFSVQHDIQGNVIQALHKGIQRIEYHPVSQRTSCIELTDGRILRFYYDAQGERILKQVLTAEGQISNETYYLRDEKGQVLADRHIKYLPIPFVKVEIVTAYLYGPRGLLGFIRNNTFYSVTTDHAGSVRLVMKSGQVVTAYDYLPYGQLMRSYGNDPQTYIMYRYTGQEWDEETGLYNYHARLYDPSIGRFYQRDPKTQYFSPYKYAGNSPISHIDPDGEFAIIIGMCVAFALGGAYLGGAAANNRWNPADWDWKDSGTWLGIGGGALAGGLAPLGFAATANIIGWGFTVGMGLGGSYVMMGTTNQNWNPLQWQWDRPHTWNALFQGFGTGSGILGGVNSVHSFATNMFGASSIGKIVFLTASYSAGGGMAYYSGVVANDGNAAFWQWDFSNPATWSALVDGFDGGMGCLQGLAEIVQSFDKLAKNPQKLGGLFDKMTTSKKQALKSILKNSKHPLFNVIGTGAMVYFMGSSANGELDITRWNFATFSTYEGILNGIFFGKDTSSMLKLARNSKLNEPPTTLDFSPKNKGNRWSETWHSLMKTFVKNINEIEYHRIMEQAFPQENLWLSKLEQQNQPSSLKQDVDNFFKYGLEAWKKGENNPPKELQKLIKQQAAQNLYGSSSKPIKWEAEAEQIAQQQRTIFPDRDAEFLGCRKLRRRKRTTGSKRVCQVDNSEQNLKKPKLEIPRLEIPKIPHGSRLELVTENGQFKIKLDEQSCNIKDILAAVTQVGTYAYTPIIRRIEEINLSDANAIKKHFSKVGIEVEEVYQKYRNKKKETIIEPIIVYIFKQNNREHRTAIAELIAYNKYKNVNKDVKYLIQDEKGTIRVRNPQGNDVVFEPAKKVGDGTKQNPYTFTNQNISYKGIKKVLNNKVHENYELAKHLYRNINLAERGRNDLGGILKMIGRQNGGLQSLRGGTGYMNDLQNEKYNKKVKNHPDGGTIGEIFSKQLINFINEKLSQNQYIAIPLPQLISNILETERLTPRSSERNHGTRKRRSLIPHVDQLELPYKEETEKLVLNIQDDHATAATSGSNNCHSWPINLVKTVGVTILSFLPGWISTLPETPNTISLHSEPRLYHHPSVETVETDPTLLEMGKYWFNNTDMTGNLTWAVLLARKWTGYRPTVSQNEYKADSTLDIEAAILVNEFVNAVLNQALACGIATPVRHILNNSSSTLQLATEAVRRKLSTGQLEAIPQLLCKQLVEQHIDQIAFVTTQKQANKLLARIIKDGHKLQQQILQQVQGPYNHSTMKRNFYKNSPLVECERHTINCDGGGYFRNKIDKCEKYAAGDYRISC